MLVTALDDIAWMLNLRGNDIQYNPLFFSYVLFHRSGPKYNQTYKADLFIDEDKVSDPAVRKHLADNDVSVNDYTAVVPKLQEYAKSLPEGAEEGAKVKISLDKGQII